jgi:hypothetical protein
MLMSSHPQETPPGVLRKAPEVVLPVGAAAQEGLHRLKVERENLLIEISAIRRNQIMPTANINANQINSFCNALKARLLYAKSGFGY